MSNKINVRMILEAKLQGFSNNTIASTRHVSKHSVNEVVKIGTRLGILPAGTIPNLTDDELYRVFFPDRWTYDSTYRLLDYERIHKDLNRTGVTLKQLWSEYCSDCRATGELHVGYTKFCEDYGSYTGMNGFASHLEHKAGDRIRHWALQFGPSTAEVVDRILQSLPIPEQTFNSALCILRLDKRYDRSRIEKACELALGMTKSPRYSNINAILKSGQDIDSSGKTPGKPESAEFCSRESSFFERLMGGAHND